MIKIPLTQGKFTLIDDEDYAIVSLFRWRYNVIRRYERAIGYEMVNEKQRTLYMHRLIMNAPNGMCVDHINHNGLDNRKQNLRICTYQQNAMNALPIKNKSSKYKGVYWDKKNKKWRVGIVCNNKKIWLGRYYEEKAAAQAYNFMAHKLYGEFAYFNDVGMLK